MDTLVHVSLDRPQAAVGDTVRAVVSWQHDGTPSGVRIELAWFTEGRGDRDRGVVQVHRQTSDQGAIPPQVEAALAIPPNGPVSYDGQLLRIRWEVRAVLELRLRRDPQSVMPLQVVPVVLS